MRRRIDGAPALFKSRAVKRAHLVDECEARRADTALRRVDSDVRWRSSVPRRQRDAHAQPPPGCVDCVTRENDDRPGASLL